MTFFDSVRSLERAEFHRLPPERRAHAVVGADVLPADERLRFKSNYQLAFPAISHLQNDKKSDSDDRQVMLVNFLQLLGAEGILPQHYTRLVISRIKQRDYVMMDFMDMFHHRLISLFYRSWAKYRLVPQYETALIQGEKDTISHLLDAVAGNLHTADETQRYYAGHFSKNNRSSQGLKTLLQDYVRHPVEIKELLGNWIILSDRNMTRLGERSPRRKITLGKGVLIGRRFWSATSKIAISIKQLNAESYQLWMPGTKRYQAIKQLIRSYVPQHIHIDLTFEIANNSALTRFDKRPQLTRSSWLLSRKNQLIHAKSTIC